MGDSGGESDIEEWSGISQPTLLDQLKTILDEYRNDVQIIKELVQNADDAGASGMKILYVGSTVNNEQSETKNILKGPAFVFYNDATFSDDDWKGIKSIYKSVKKNDPLKVGRFGLGFKSVFHMTDNPCIVSGDTILFINPLEKESDQVCVSVKLKKLRRYKRHRSIMNALDGIFDFSENTITNGSYPGTLFWFSLRQTPSELSSDTYHDQQVHELLEAFMEESCRSLIFLKTLCSVHIYVELNVSPDPPVKKRRRKKLHQQSNFDSLNYGRSTACFSAVISNADKGKKCLVDSRREVMNELEEIRMSIPKSPKHWVFDVIVETNKSSHSETSNASRSRWLIVVYLKGQPVSNETQTLLDDKDLQYPTVVGLAAPISETGQYTDINTHVFCYQPLPQENTSTTALPVHVNAFFALGQNRRNIRWPDIDNEGHEVIPDDNKIKWNLALRSEFLPYAYRHLCHELIELSKKMKNDPSFVAAVYNIIPNLRNTGEHWAKLAETVIDLFGTQGIIYTETKHGAWIEPNKALIMDEREFSTVGNEAQEVVYDLLYKDNSLVAKVPKHVKYSLEKIHRDELTFVTPRLLKEHLNKHITYRGLDFKTKIQLMEFILLDDSSDGLDDIELVPLADDTFTSFSNENIYSEASDVMKLFPGQETRFLSGQLKKETRQKLEKLIVKGQHRIHRMNAANSAELMEALILKKFKNLEPKCVLAEGKKWVEWIQNIWKFIQKRYMETIAKFESLPLFPIDYSPNASKVKLIGLCSHLLHLPRKKYSKEREIIEASFKFLSVFIVQGIPEWIDSTISNKYLFEDTEEGIAELLERIDEAVIDRFNENIIANNGSICLQYLSDKLQNVSEIGKRKLRKMKLFKGVLKSRHKSVLSISECEEIYIGSTYPFPYPVPYPIKVIVVNPGREMTFAKSLGGNHVSELDMIMNTFNKFIEYNQEEKDKFIEWVIKGKNFKNANVQDCLKDIPFLRTKSKKLHKPSELFDPTARDKLLRDLFMDADVFPNIDETRLKKLRELGLKAVKDLSKADINRICDDIDKKCNSKMKVDKRQCVALRKVMEELSEKGFDKQEVWAKRCIIIEHSGEQPNLYSTQNTDFVLCRPSDIKSNKHSKLIYTEMYLVNSNKFPNLSRCFDWEKPPSSQQVINHLFNTVMHYKERLKVRYLPIIVAIYGFLSQSQHDIKKALYDKFAPLENRFVWTGNGFQSPKHVYTENTDGDIELHPFLQLIPPEVEQYADFFNSLGCRRNIDADVYLNTLDEIRDVSEDQTKPLSDKKLIDMVIAILNKVMEEYLEDVKSSGREIYFPVQNKGILKMRPTKECTYCDAQWLKDMDLNDIDDDIEYVHERVPERTADALGVPSLRQQMLSSSEAFEEWGQEEPLTRRLRTLLNDGYVDGFSVAKELLQNADDAGAKSLKIMYDERENNDSKTKLLSDSMAELQGPAIWVYNDALFTEKDLKNITQLNAATKESDCSKIGRFGLGFCAVYNVTDVPSFCSGSDMVMFDPHTTYLGWALPGNSPGLRINFRFVKNKKLLKRLRNQFKPFDDVFGCQLTACDVPFYNGTLFRLPLRNRASDICDKVYTKMQVKKLFETIMKLSSNMLLFNQNVTTVELYHLPKDVSDASKQVLLFTTSKQILRTSCNIDIQQRSILKEASDMKKRDVFGNQQLTVLEEISVEIKIMANKGSAFIRTKPKTIPYKWLVSWSTGNKDQSLEIAKREKWALVLGAVAVPWQITGQTNAIMPFEKIPSHFYQKGHYFFFLPLPIEQGMPFHINGQFAVKSDRQSLITSSEGDRNILMKTWNECLMNDAITKSLLHLLVELRKIVDVSKYDYQQLWPTKTDYMLKHLCQSFYQHIVLHQCYDVFEKDGRWFNISKCLFIERKFRQSSVGSIAFNAFNYITLPVDAIVVDIRDELYGLMKTADSELVMGKTVSDVTFYTKYFLPQLDKFDRKNLKDDRNSLIMYAIELNDPAVNELLAKEACIPSQPKGSLKRPCQLVDETSKLAELFSTSDGFFPLKIFSELSTTKCLCNLGMMHERLTDDMVLYSANSVEQIESMCSVCALKRSSALLEYLGEREIHIHEDILDKIQYIQLMPVSPKPKMWPFKWEADSIVKERDLEMKCKKHRHRGPKSVTLSKSKGLYCWKLRNLVGSMSLVLDENVCSKQIELLNALGVHSECDLMTVVGQLQLMSDTYTRKGNIDVRTHFDFIYSFLDKACADENQSMSIKNKLQTKNIVWMDGLLICPEKVAERTSYNCSPHLYSLQRSPMKLYSNLRKCLGINELFAPGIFVKTLQDIKEYVGNSPVQGREIDAILNLLRCYISRGGDTPACIVYGPDENGILRDCKTMCFNDFDDVEKSETMNYSHPDMPTSLAKSLGVKPKLLHSIEENAEDIEDFFQDEPLLTRIQNLVEGYPCDVGIFKELLQNADDAKASEMHFLLDYDTHRNDDIFHGLNKLQGPALCVFNNSAFSRGDLTAITKLGRGNKSEDTFKTGRYGVGFNAVYNLTDVPSFLTWGGDIENKETLCFFDPMACFVPSVTKSKPGKRYKNIASMRKHKKNIMEGYHERHFQKFSKGTGSIFRLPLRTAALANKSKIKNHPVEPEMVFNLLDKFCKELKNVILFLKHLNAVTISVYRQGGYSKHFTVERTMDKTQREVYRDLIQTQRDFSKCVSDSSQNMLTFPFQSVVSDITLNESLIDKETGLYTCNKNRTKYIVMHTIGFKNPKEIPSMLSENITNRKVGFLPTGAVAIRKDIEPNSDEHCLAYCFLPLPIPTGLPVHVHGYFALDNETRRTLWKSEHADACYKTLWNLVLLEQVIAPAYSLLINYIRENIIEPQKNKWREDAFESLRYYLSIIPTDNLASDTYWKHLTKFVYKDLVNGCVPFLPILNTLTRPRTNLTGDEWSGIVTWTPLKRAGHKFPAYRNDAPGFNEAFNSFRDLELLENIKLRSVTILDAIQDSMRTADCEIESLSPLHMMNYLTSFNSDYIDKCDIKIDMKVSKTILHNSSNVCKLLKFCMQDRKSFCGVIKKIPLFLTMDGILGTLPQNGYLFVETIVSFCTFFPSLKGRFLDSNVAYLMRSYMEVADNVLKPFTLPRFMELMEETKVIQCTSSIELWDKKSLSKNWIERFWRFFYNAFEREQYRCNTSNELRSSVSDHLSIINTLPIIPAFKNTNVVYLVSPACVKKMINLLSFDSMPVLHAALTEINILQLYTALLPNDSTAANALSLQSLLNTVLPDFTHPEEVLTCLHLNIENVRGCSLSMHASTTILRYFADRANGSWLNNSMISKFKDLPLYTTHFEDIVPLSYYLVTFVAPVNIPLDGLKALATRCNILFLKDVGLMDLYKVLNINIISLVDVYVQCIIPNHGTMERSAFYKHVIFLANNGYQDDPRIHSILKMTPFINVASGDAVLVKELFDPEVKLFSYMCTDSELVPLELRGLHTLEMLRKLGLQTTLNVALTERFATTIQEDNQMSQKARNSKVLLQHLFKMPEAFFTNGNFHSIRVIKFVQPLEVGRELQDIYPQFNVQKYICFDESVLSSGQFSCWTTSELLPEMVDKVSRYRTEIRSKLGIREWPTFEKLTIHCKYIGTSAKDRRKSSAHVSLPAVMNEIYKCLEHYKESEVLNEADFRKLCDVPIVYQKEMQDMITPRQTLISCKDEEEIPPFINKCPMEYAQHHELFILLGCWKHTSYNMYASVLFALRDYGDASGHLLPKQLVDAVKAFGLMFKHLCQVTTQTEIDEQNQYLLSECNTLRKANSLVINDNRIFSDAIKKDKDQAIQCSFLYPFDKLKEFNLKRDSCIDCLKYLPENMRPHLLKSLAKRKVVLDNIQGKEKEPANILNEFIHCREFIHGFLRLVRHVLKNINLSHDIQNWSDSEEPKVAAAVQNINFQHVTGIMTVLCFKCLEGVNAGKEVTVSNTKEAGLVHLEKKDDAAILYFDTSERNWSEKVKMEIALFLNELVDGILRDKYFVLLVEIISLKDEAGKIPIVLSQSSIDEYQCAVEIEDNPIYPVPGTFVPRKWHQYLDNDFGVFQSYDYKFVALEMDDQVISDNDNSDNEDVEESESTYMFVHIIRKSEEVNEFPLLQEYVIDDGSDTTYAVKAYRLYKFMCKKPTNTDRRIVPYEGQSSAKTGDQDIKATRKEVREYLTTAWKQPEAIRRKLVLRLLLKWHPDKNPDNVQFCTKVFQYIQQCLRRLEKGQQLPDDDDDETRSSGTSGSSSGYRSSYWQSSWYGRYWKRRHRRRHDYDEFDGFFSFTTHDQEPYHWLSEARRWFKQATSDQESARKAFGNNNITCNWICYMSHQAGEKSLKAAWYAKDANKIHRVKYSHNLTSMAGGLSSTLVTMAQELCRLTGDHTRMRYPDTMSGEAIPAYAYSKETAESVIAKAQDILNFVQVNHLS